MFTRPSGIQGTKVDPSQEPNPNSKSLKNKSLFFYFYLSKEPIAG
jgi:hypothetical protein